MSYSEFIYADALPYPPVEVCRPNPGYAMAILSNIGACNSEMSAVSLYFYNSIVAAEPYAEVAECFHKVSMVEMHHLDIFGRLAYLLGANPRLWDCSSRRPVYWTPGCNQYPCQLEPLLKNAIRGEEEAIAKYRKQTEWIEDPHIIANLNRIILDEEHHIRIFNTLYKKYVIGKGPHDIQGNCKK